MKSNFAGLAAPPASSPTAAPHGAPADPISLDSLDAALQAAALAEVSLNRLSEDRPKGIALEAARQKAAEARAASEAIFFPHGRGELPERRDANSRRTAAMDALAAAERGRERLLGENAGDAALDVAEMAIKRAARAVEREIAAGAALDEKQAAARKAALAAAWDNFYGPYAQLQNEFAGHLRAALMFAEKLRRINSFVEQTGACPATGCLPWPSDEYLIRPAAIEDYLKDLAKAAELNEFYTAKRSAAA